MKIPGIPSTGHGSVKQTNSKNKQMNKLANKNPMRLETSSHDLGTQISRRTQGCHPVRPLPGAKGAGLLGQLHGWGWTPAPPGAASSPEVWQSATAPRPWGPRVRREQGDGEAARAVQHQALMCSGWALTCPALNLVQGRCAGGCGVSPVALGLVTTACWLSGPWEMLHGVTGNRTQSGQGPHQTPGPEVPTIAPGGQWELQDSCLTPLCL